MSMEVNETESGKTTLEGLKHRIEPTSIYATYSSSPSKQAKPGNPYGAFVS